MSSIRKQLTLQIVAGFALLLMVSGSAIYGIMRLALYQGFDEALKARAMMVVAQTEQTSSGVQLEPSVALAQQFDNPQVPQYFQIRLVNGTLAAKSASLGDRVIPERAGLDTRPQFWNQSLPAGFPGRLIGFNFQPKFEDDQHTNKVGVVEVSLVVASDRRELERTLAILASVLGFSGALALALTVPVVRFAVRRGHAPLAALAEQAAGIQAESLQNRFPVATLPEELRPISGKLNELLARLEKSFARERQFSADLAHELRTPLAELRAQSEVGLQFGDVEARETCQETLLITLQMQGIVTRLLELSRSDNCQLPLRPEMVRVAELVADVWRPHANEVATKNLAVQFEIPESAELQTDRVLLRSILENLVANAVAYTPERGWISVVWSASSSALSISNHVHDLEPTDLPHLFERLWRKDNSRTGTQHHGLGLALSRAYAQLLGLKLTACFMDDKTLELVLLKA